MPKTKAREPEAKIREAETKYRERAKTAPLVTTEGEWRTKITVAVWWPDAWDSGYGMGTRCDTMEAALTHARSDLALGYGRDPKRNVVHVIETRTRIIEVGIGDA